MKRNNSVALLRGILALGVVFALPFSHLMWGKPYPGDGQEAFGFLIIFTFIGMVAAVVFGGLGTLGQFLLRRRETRLTVFVDIGLFLLVSGVLVYGGIKAKYKDSQPNNGTEAIRP